MDSLGTTCSPHDIADYEEEIFPVVDTELGKIGVAFATTGCFGAIVNWLERSGDLLRVSAYMDLNSNHPWIGGLY